LQFDEYLVDGESEVFVHLLGPEQLLIVVEEGTHLGDLGENVSANLLSQGISISQLVVNLSYECIELFEVDGEVRSEVEPGLDGERNLLELLESLLVLVGGCLLALAVDPVDGLLEMLHECDALRLLNVLLHGSVAVDVVLQVVGERLKLILGRLKVQDVVVVVEPMLFLSEEVFTDLRRKCEVLGVALEVRTGLLVLLADLILLLRGLHWCLRLLLLHLGVGGWLLLLTISRLVRLGCLGGLRGSGNIFLDRDLLLLNPFLLKIG
jgi:hypothetical protein